MHYIKYYKIIRNLVIHYIDPMIGNRPYRLVPDMTLTLKNDPNHECHFDMK